MNQKKWQRLASAAGLLLALIALPALAQGPAPGAAERLSPPLGFRDGHTYAPHLQRDDQGHTIEDTRYSVQNPDMIGQTCFGVAWEQLYHSGQDLYRTDGAGTEGAEVTAVADGTVAYANPYLNYPGLVVIVEHNLGDRKLYSVYAHIDDNSLEVSQGQQVQRGQRLGLVMYQRYSGRFPERHPSGDDSHLHFELRHFLDGRSIYGPKYPACNGLVAGRGYTYPQQPNDFPAPSAGYVDPAGLIEGS